MSAGLRSRNSTSSSWARGNSMSTNVTPASESATQAASKPLATSISRSSRKNVTGKPMRMPERGLGVGAGRSVRAPQAIAASAAERVNNPSVSRSGESGNTPSVGKRPQELFQPTIPQSAAGTRTDPPVSDPIANGASPAATAADDPLDDPPGAR